MAIEIELKFKIGNPILNRERLKKLSAKFIGKAFERTIRFDTKNKELEKEGKFLRVRTGFKNTITFKKKIEKSDKRFREREEIEFEISDPKKMQVILENIGFTRKLIMEKYREKWQWGSAEIVIDRLPFGYFIEIEGSGKAILKTINSMELDFQDKITDTYWGLWEVIVKNIILKTRILFFNNCYNLVKSGK